MLCHDGTHLAPNTRTHACMRVVVSPHAQQCWLGQNQSAMLTLPTPQSLVHRGAPALHASWWGKDRRRPARAGMLAGDGRCKALDAGADGYVRSEGLGLLALRSVSSLDPAEPPGGGGAGVLVTGSAVNQDGRSSGLTAPNGPSQQNLMRIALAGAHLPAHMVCACAHALLSASFERENSKLAPICLVPHHRGPLHFLFARNFVFAFLSRRACLWCQQPGFLVQCWLLGGCKNEVNGCGVCRGLAISKRAIPRMRVNSAVVMGCLLRSG